MLNFDEPRFLRIQSGAVTMADRLHATIGRCLYMIDLPREVDEAATVDGASRTQTFWRIILPMCRPILVSAALLQALFAWNEFVFALVFISSDSLKTLPVGLVSMQSRLLTDWPVVFAGLTIAALPMILLFLIGQRQFLRGLTEGVGK